MKIRIYFYAFLGVYVISMGILAVNSFRQNFPVRKSSYLTRITIKNESKKAIKTLNLIDAKDNVLSVLDQEIEAGDSTKIDINCGVFTVHHKDNKGNGCNWGKIDTCNETTIIIKAKCPGKTD